MPNFAAWDPPQESPPPASQRMGGLPGHEKVDERLLTSGGWAEGWSRSLTPGSPSSHSTISPPGRRSRSGRLPAAPAPSPSRTQVCNDGVMKIQQISHKSSSPATPFPHRLVLESIIKDSSHCMLLLLLHGDRGVIDAAEQVWRALLPWVPSHLKSIHTGNHYSPRCKPQCKQAQQGGGRGNLEAPRRNPQWEVKSKPGSNKKQTNSVSVRTKNAAPGHSEAPAANTRDVKPSTRSSPGPATLSTSLPRTYRTDWPVPVGVARDTRVKLTGIKLRTSCCGFQNKTSTRWYVTSFCL